MVRIVLEQPAVARFLVRKLYRFLVSEMATPSDSLLEPLCESFRASDYDIAALVRTILSSRHFYSSHAFRRKIKGPVEYVLGAVQAVYRRYDEEEADYRPMPQQALVGPIDAMGQALFAPPNVKGWPGGSSWLNTSTVLERDNFAEALAMGTLWHPASSEPADRVTTDSRSQGPIVREIARLLGTRNTPEEPAPPRAFDPARLLQEEGVSRPEDIVRSLLDLYLPGGVRPDVRGEARGLRRPRASPPAPPSIVGCARPSTPS